MIRVIVGLLLSLLFAGEARATCASIPFTFTNGTLADATQVNSDFTALLNCINAIDAGQVTTGSLATARGGTGQTTAPIFTSSAVSAGGNVTSTTGAMFGATKTFTPATTGKVQIVYCGYANTTSTDVSFTLQAGTGTPPVYNAAPAGNQIGQTRLQGPAGGGSFPFCMVGTKTLTAGVAAWADINAQTVGGVAVAISFLQATVVEAPI